MTAPDLTQAVWRKSSRSSTQGNCVEVAFASSGELATVAVRDSKNVPTGDGHVLAVPAAGWSTFLRTLRS